MLEFPFATSNELGRPMYEKIDKELEKIVQLAESCPDALQEKAFEILLQGYVSSLLPRMSSEPVAKQGKAKEAHPQTDTGLSDDSWKEGIPEDVLPRFQIMASRMKLKPSQLADVFDFSTDPFTFAAVHIEGKSNRKRMYRVAMLVAARSFLATGRWSADWAEIKAMCTHQNCYDVNNFAGNLASAEGDWFKKVNTRENVQTSAKGQKEAERLVKELAGGSDAT